MHVSKFESLAYDLMDDTKTPYVQIKVTKGPDGKGACVMGKVVQNTWYASGIVFNENYVKVIDKRQAVHVILHEIAHVKTFPAARHSETMLNPHGPKWVAECRKLGIKAHAKAKKWPLPY